MCAIEEVVGTEGGFGVLPEVLEVNEKIQKIDFKIYSNQRPKICTDFQEIKLFENKVVVTLSDGSQWKIIAKDVSKVFETISNSWVRGDDIRFNDSNKNYFILKNVRDKTAFLAELEDKCVNTINTLFIKAIDRSGYAMVTSDDRLWVAGYIGACSTQSWQVGDRVIINKSGHGDSYDNYDVINMADPKISIWVTQVFNDLQILR